MKLDLSDQTRLTNYNLYLLYEYFVEIAVKIYVKLRITKQLNLFKFGPLILITIFYLNHKKTCRIPAYTAALKNYRYNVI